MDEVENVDVVDISLALVNLALDPMSVKITEQVVDVLGSNSVSVPLADIKCQKSLAAVVFGLVAEAPQMLRQVFCQLLVQILAEKMCYRDETEESANKSTHEQYQASATRPGRADKKTYLLSSLLPSKDCW